MIQTYSFTSLFRDDIPLGDGQIAKASRVEIPRIQRPYAQGRLDEDSQRVRKIFLKVLFTFLLGDKSLFDLDFIYGKMEQGPKPHCLWTLQILDGQQRLTTLFLMHFYFLVRERPASDTPEYKRLVDALGAFTYETRDSSADFCSMLVRDLDQFSFAKIKPSLEIRSLLDYVDAFDEDPTVDAMLTMLDAIHEQYCRDVPEGQKGTLLPRLDCIKFRVLSLTNYMLSEELYIKMNARGLPLTPFEMFKPNFLDLMDAIPGEFRLSTGEKASDGDEDKVSFKLFFATKMDTIWCDAFWDGSNPKSYEVSYLKFFSRYFAAKFVLENQGKIRGKEWEKNETLKCLLNTFEDDVTHYHGIAPFGDLASPTCFRDIAKLLCLLSNPQTKMEIIAAIKPLWESLDNSDWLCNGKASFTQPTLALFSAVIEFFRLFPFHTDSFKVWMKSVNIIVENTDINDKQSMASVVGNLAYLLKEVHNKNGNPASESDFIKAMASVSPDGCHNAQSKEEIGKAKRIVEDITQSQQWTDVFDMVARDPFLKGMIGFFYSDAMTINEFKNHIFLIASLFDANGIALPYRAEPHWMIRAIMAQITNRRHLATQYILETATNRYLKNTLASLSHDDFRSRMRHLFSESLKGLAPAPVGKASQTVLQKFTEAFKNPPPVDKNQSWDVMETIRVLREGEHFYKWVFAQNGAVKVYYNYNNRQYQARLGSSQTCLMVPLLRFMAQIAKDEGMTQIPMEDDVNGFDEKHNLFVGQNCSMEKSLSSFPKAVVRVRFYSAQYADYAVELSAYLPAEEEHLIGAQFPGTSKPEGKGVRHLILDRKFSPDGDENTISLNGLKAEIEKYLKVALPKVASSAISAPTEAPQP